MTHEQAVKADMGLYWRLLSYVRPYKAAFLLSILGWLLYSAMQIAFIDVLQYIVRLVRELGGGVVDAGGPVVDAGVTARLVSMYLGDNAIESGRLIIPLLLVFIALLRGIGFFVGSYFIAWVSSWLVHNLRTDLFNKMTRLPSVYFDRNMSGHLVSRITFHVEQVTGAATESVKTLISEGFTVIGFLSYMIWVSWKLTLLFLIILPIIAFVVTVVGRRFRRISQRIQTAMGDVTHVSQEAVSGFPVMRIFGGEQYERDRMLRASTANRRQALKMAATEGVSSPVIQMLISVVLSVLIFFALEPRMIQELSVENFVAYLTAAGALTRPIRRLSGINAVIQKGLAAAQVIFHTMDADEEKDTGTVAKDRVQGDFSFRDVGFSYDGGKTNVLSSVSFDVSAGETVALVGASGGGKSTLVNLIPRFYSHMEGKILLDGIDINDYQLGNLRSHISLVSQQVVLFNDTVFNNIAYGALADAAPEKVRDAARAAHALEFIEKLNNGFDTIVGDNGVMLSGGQRQRIAIARALLKEAPILILDEATSALDTESEGHIQAALEELMKNRTTFVIAHRLSTIENADRILVMNEGRIVEQGKHAQLLAANGWYTQLHRKGLEAKDTGPNELVD